jgi:ribulose-5-phosphate 4-epimerase/fuculose-1-phosphate aldolase
MTATLDTQEHLRADGWLDAGDAVLTGRDSDVRDELIEAVHYLHAHGALQNHGSANFSALLPDSPGRVLLSAKGLPADISAADFGVVTREGEFVGGRLGPGVQKIIRMHTLAYDRPDVTSVLHTHSYHATAFALAQKAIPPHYEPLVNRGQTVEIPVAPYRQRNNGDLGDSVRALLAQHPDTHAVLLANHGVLAFSDGPLRTAELVAVIEEAATLEIYAASLGGSKAILP